MKIIGDINTATKFYIINSIGNIEWVPNLAIAKQYIETSSCTEWYGKELYATNEDIVLDKNGKTYLKSQLPEEKVFFNKETEYNILEKQAYTYINAILNEYILSIGYESINTLISWYNSKITPYKDDAKNFIKYRDALYIYTLEFLKQIKNNSQENILTFSDVYDEYIININKIRGKYEK